MTNDTQTCVWCPSNFKNRRTLLEDRSINDDWTDEQKETGCIFEDWIPPSRIVVDSLHLLLRVFDRIFGSLVVPELRTALGPSEAHRRLESEISHYVTGFEFYKTRKLTFISTQV